MAWAVVGFVAFRWLDRIFRDDGSGDLYLWSSILVVMAIVLFFRGNGSYAVNLGRKLYPEGIRYKSMLSFEEGVGWEEFADLMKFSSVYITIYEAAFCFLLAMFIRSVWNPVSYTHLDVYKRQIVYGPKRKCEFPWTV